MNTKNTLRLYSAIALTCICGAYLALAIATQTPHDFLDKEYQLRKLEPAELSIISNQGRKGDCGAAYRVARHHLYYTLNDDAAEIFLRIAAKCQNPFALAHLASLLTDKPAFDGEVDRILVRLKKLDLKMGEEAAVQIAMRRGERKFR
jgi:hypothetical protein